MNNEVSSSRISHRALTIAVEGNIGAGKSTFLSYCAAKTDILVLPEPVEKWRNLNGANVLRHYYDDPNCWAIPFQLYAGLTIMDHYAYETGHRLKLIERSLLSARHVFLAHMKRHDTIEPAMGHIMDVFYDRAAMEHVNNPHAIVYLRTTPAIALARLQGRGRSAESAVSLRYIQDFTSFMNNGSKAYGRTK